VKTPALMIDRHDGGERGGTLGNETPHGGGQTGDALAGLERLPNEAVRSLIIARKKLVSQRVSLENQMCRQDFT
jgi:hypothetical protein